MDKANHFRRGRHVKAEQFDYRPNGWGFESLQVRPLLTKANSTSTFLLALRGTRRDGSLRRGLQAARSFDRLLASLRNEAPSVTTKGKSRAAHFSCSIPHLSRTLPSMNCNQFRRRIGDVSVIADYYERDHAWRVAVTDMAGRPVSGAARRVALSAFMNELSGLRQYIWHEELGNRRDR